MRLCTEGRKNLKGFRQVNSSLAKFDSRNHSVLSTDRRSKIALRHARLLAQSAHVVAENLG